MASMLEGTIVEFKREFNEKFINALEKSITKFKIVHKIKLFVTKYKQQSIPPTNAVYTTPPIP